MRAARSDSDEDRFEAAAHRFVERRALRQPLGPAEDRRQRVVQLVGDAGDRLPERGHLLGLQQLVIDVARFVVQLLALADVAHQRFDAQRLDRRPARRRAPVSSTQTGLPSARRSRSR